MNHCGGQTRILTNPPRELTRVLEDWDFLRRQGFTMRQAADRMGMTYPAFERAIDRAKAAGDPRAVRRAS